ncbi:MAG TPA: hypothetical protein VF859_02720 [Burkholderiales bacterium]
MALGVLAIGGVALGYFAFGGAAIAWHAALGGLAVAGDYALGGGAFATHANDAPARRYFSEDLLFAAIRWGMEHSQWLLLLVLIPAILALRGRD